MIKHAPEHHSHLFKMKKSSLIQMAIVVVAIVLLLPQVKEFAGSWDLLTQANLAWVFVAFGAMSMTLVFAALVYIFLVPVRLPFRRTALIQLATYFTNRLLPSGLGGIGFNAVYLVRQAGLSRTDAAIYASANNLVGFIAFMLCSVLSTVIGDSEIQTELPIKKILLITAVVLIVIAIISLAFQKVQKRVIDTIAHLFGVALELSKHPHRVLLATAASIGITLSYVVMLWASTKSVGINLSIVDLFIAFIAGNAALTVSPTPGGLGAVEAAIASVLISADIAPATALAGVFVFRFVSYWAPIPFGYLAFKRATTRRYV